MRTRILVYMDANNAADIGGVVWQVTTGEHHGAENAATPLTLRT